MIERGRCRSCGSDRLQTVLDLGPQPPANELVDDPTAVGPEVLPLVCAVCLDCWLLQLRDTKEESVLPGEGLTVSSTIRHHQEALARRIADRLELGPTDLVIDTASHGGHLQPLLRDQGIRSRTVEGSPAAAAAARDRGLDVEQAELDLPLADRVVARLGPARAVVDYFGLAHVLDLPRRLAGVRSLLATDGMAVFEFDDAGPMILDVQYDAIRHGHAAYFTLTSFAAALALRGLAVQDVERIDVYGGSLRAWVVRDDAPRDPPSQRVAELLEEEQAAGLAGLAAYERFAARVDLARRDLTDYLRAARDRGRLVLGYGAPSRASTLLNASGVTADLLAFTVDASPAKQGRFLPGSGVPVRAPSDLRAARPDDILILTWDIADEVMASLGNVRAWGGRFVVPIPSVREIVPAQRR